MTRRETLRAYERSLAIKQAVKDDKPWAQKAVNPLVLSPQQKGK